MSSTGIDEGQPDLSRKQRRDVARAQRKAAEQVALATAARRTRLTQLGIVLAVVVVGIVAVLIATGGGEKKGIPSSPTGQQGVTKEVSSLVAGIPQNGNILGSPTAPVTLQYFGDLECPVCRQFTLSALLSVTPGQNLFVAPDGRWLGSYVPAGFRTYPFRLATPEGAERSILCVDQEYVVSVDDPSPGTPFFATDGTPTAMTQQNLDYLTALERSNLATELAVSALAQAGVIKPWPLTIKSERGDRTVNGISCIDEAALNALPNEDFLRLRATGALPLAYAQLLSMGQIAIFEHLVRMQTQLAPQPLTPLPDSLDRLFDQTNNLEIKFG